VYKEQAHHEFEHDRLSNWIAREASHHVSVHREIITRVETFIQADLMTLDDQQKRILSVS
jgi:hypothetical protein